MIRTLQVFVALLAVLVALPAGAAITLTGNAAWLQNVFAASTSASVSPAFHNPAGLWDGNVVGVVQTAGTTGLNDTRYYQVNWSGGATIGSIWMFAPGQSSAPNWQAGNVQYKVGAGSYQTAGTADGSTGRELFGYPLGPQANVTSVQINITAPLYWSGGSPAPYYYGQLNEVVGLADVTQRIIPTGYGQSSSLLTYNASKLYDFKGTGQDYSAGTAWYSQAPGSDPNPWAYNTWLGTPRDVHYLLISTGDQDSAGSYQPNKYSIYTLKLGGDPTLPGDWNWQFSVDGIPATSGQMQLLSLPSSVVTEGVKIYVDSPRSGGATFAELIVLVPEPSAVMLFGLGGLLLGWRRRWSTRIG